MKLSIIVPIYNESRTIRALLNKLKAVRFPESVEIEVIVVDDGSTDGTRDILKNLGSGYTVLFHEKNKGKGSAIRTGLVKASGDYVVIQDGDLEYDPRDIRRMLETIVANGSPVLYGSRQLLNNTHGRLPFYAGGLFLTWIANILYRQHLTDEPTCYKMFKTDFLKSLPLACERFEFCPEVTALSALRGIQIPEIGISYHPRDVRDGKKIRWHDGIEAIWTLVKYRFCGIRKSVPRVAD